MLRCRAVWLAVAISLLQVGCGGVTHDDIAAWQGARDGKEKLTKALTNEALAADLRAHAAECLIAGGDLTNVKQLFESGAGGGAAVADKLVERLIAAAAVPEGYRPSPAHVEAKDGLFYIRGFADAGSRAAADKFLAEWLGANFDDRKDLGRVGGVTLVRHIGTPIAPYIVRAARKRIAAPAQAQRTVARMSDDLLTALAYTGDPEAVGLLIDLGTGDQPEETLRRRATAAAYVAFVKDTDPPRPNPAGLVPQAQKLLELAQNPATPGSIVNDAIALLAATGRPTCLDPLLALVRAPRQEEAALWVAVREGVKCAGADGVAAVVQAIPEGNYSRGILEKYLWDKMWALADRPGLLASCRKMLASPSPLVRVTGVECVGHLGSAGDAKDISALADDKAVLNGWWGDSADRPQSERKNPPQLGTVAQEVAKRLENR